MDYIAVLDYEHMDNGMFLSAFAKSLASQKNSRGLIIHGDSDYTERLIQTGMMREDAEKRAIKDLNHRLIALFADYGVSTIGLNAYQRSLVSKTGSTVSIDKQQLQQLPPQPHLLISNLVHDTSTNQPVPLSLKKFAAALATKFAIERLLVFSLDESDNLIQNNRPEQISLDDMNDSFAEKYLPEEFRNVQHNLCLTTAQDFGNFPDLKNFTVIKI